MEHYEAVTYGLVALGTAMFLWRCLRQDHSQVGFHRHEVRERIMPRKLKRVFVSP